jgi:two-component system, NarL family, nitrate/nitrite response regulator NarL
MPQRTQSGGKHLFVSPTGVALPRWLEAFPKATIVERKELCRHSELVKQATIAWLHLDAAKPSIKQLESICEEIGPIKLIVLADIPDNEDALSLFSAGARGYCNAHATAANLKQVASVVKTGGLWIGQALMARLVVATRNERVSALLSQQSIAAPVIPSAKLRALTSREREVASKIASGSSNKEIARLLGITDRTVKAHVSAIFHKLDARDRLQVALIVNGHRSI